MSDNEAEIRDLKERLALLESSSERVVAPAPSPQLKASPKRGLSGLGVAAVVIAGLGFLWFVGDGHDDGSTETSRAIAAEIRARQSDWMPPPGYAVHEAGNGGRVGVEWDKPKRGECRGSGVACIALNLISEKDCPRNLYVSITLLDGSDQNVGWTNDTAQGVRMNEPVRLVFQSYTDGVKTARVAEVSCY